MTAGGLAPLTERIGNLPRFAGMTADEREREIMVLAVAGDAGEVRVLADSIVFAEPPAAAPGASGKIRSEFMAPDPRPFVDWYMRARSLIESLPPDSAERTALTMLIDRAAGSHLLEAATYRAD